MTRALRLLAAALVSIAPLAAPAQHVPCNPTAPRTDPGSGFVPFGASEQALARGGNSGPAWEWALGTDTSSAQKVQGSLDWVSGRVYGWTLNYSGTGSATLQILDGASVVLSLTYPSGMDAGNALQLLVATNPSIGPDITISATASAINGQPVTASASQTGNNLESAQSAYLYFPPMAQGFTAQGTVALTYATLPSGSRVNFRVRAGTLPCTNLSSTVAVTAPAGGGVVQAGSVVTVRADAQDADGTVAQVEFFANGVSIGVDTTAPYEVQWTPTAGAVALTARATDNAGDQTLSAAAHVEVNAQPTVSLTGPLANAIFTAPATVNITAEAQDPDGAISRVEIYGGSALIATLTSAPYSFAWTSVAAGGYVLSVLAFDDRGGMGASAGVPITVNSGMAKLHFIYADHLNTPRLVADAAGTTVWRWDQAEPFGDNPANDDPDWNSAAFDLPLRLPGQRYDAETALHYNFYRDYDPGLGIYKQSDPIGLASGPNTYTYVRGSPLRLKDFFGLETCGSGGNEPWVPDNPLLFPFSECCRAHDACYDDCVRQLSKGRCDNDFQSCTLRKCQRRWTGVKFACELLAVTYYAFVNSSGASAFEDARKKCPVPFCVPRRSE